MKLLKHMLFYTIVIVPLTSTAGEPEWLSNWIIHEGHRYRVTVPMHWLEAEELATAVGGHLV